MRFTRHKGGGVSADVDAAEGEAIAQLAGQLLDLVEPATMSDDPLAALVGLPDGDVDPPDNPVLERLLPSAYRDDPDGARDFRRYTDHDLRALKRRHAQTVIDTLPVEGGRMVLDRDQADAWLGFLNDIRLALGTALEVTEDTDLDELDEDDPRFGPLLNYTLLGLMQESLLSCLDPRVLEP